MRAAAAEVEKKLVRVNEFITVSELADILKVPATQIVSFAFKNLGLMVTINQRLDFDQIELIASEFGFNAQKDEEYAASAVETVADAPATLRTRPPVVTITTSTRALSSLTKSMCRRRTVVPGGAMAKPMWCEARESSCDAWSRRSSTVPARRRRASTSADGRTRLRDPSSVST